jgi:hypothetical protein
MFGPVSIKVDFSDLNRWHNMIGALGKKAPQAIRRAINHTGAKARTAMVKALIPQTGMRSKTINKAMKATKAFDGAAGGFVPGKGSLSYVIRSQGGDISLKYFKPAEGKGGVTARPWGKSTFYPNAFRKSAYGRTKGGMQKRKINPKFHGHAFINAEGGKWGGKIKVMKSGLLIPEEMVSGASAAAFHSTVDNDLPNRIEHELLWALGGGR